MSEHAPPPTYSQQEPEDSQTRYDHEVSEPQILIIPTSDSVSFQKGFLGAEGERATIEGELQLKAIDHARWGRVTISLRSFESAYHDEIELSFVEVELFRRSSLADSTFPSSLPFSIPLLHDTPQSIQTPHSLLGHNLTATLYPVDGRLPVLSKRLTVHTRRYSSHSLTLPASPEIHSIDDPTRVEVQLPRSTFTSGEPIPLYVTVPPPSRETVVDKGLRLRNVRAELIRVVKVRREPNDDDDADSDSDLGIEESDAQLHVGSSYLDAHAQHSESSSSKMPISPLFLGSSYRAIVAKSGASCRFHSTRPIKLRFVLHQNSSGTPSESHTDLRQLDNDIDHPLITQSTLLHAVSFHLKVHVSFVDRSNQTERISTIVIPVVILPPPAPLPQVSQAVDDAYQKKHDRPPTKTNRQEDFDPSIPHYSENEAGPSMLSHGAPPPFEERDAPPPFFVSAYDTPSTSRLPTFQESENEIILPEVNDLMDEVPVLREVPGEGVIFGFPPDQQFDGHSEDMQRSLTPPPTLEMASRDTDLTALADQPSHITIEAISLVLDQGEETVHVEEQPPPPPAMDDPSDPPPSIDSDFRSPAALRQASPGRAASPSYHTDDVNSTLQTTSVPPSEEVQTSHGHAPPPYLNTVGHHDLESDQVVRPPPYAD